MPGDIISIKLGDIIPADARLLEGDPLKIDQARVSSVYSLVTPYQMPIYMTHHIPRDASICKVYKLLQSVIWCSTDELLKLKHLMCIS